MISDDNRMSSNRFTLEWANLFMATKSFLRDAENPLILIAPFIDPLILDQLVEVKAPALVITSWRPDHLVSGVSSLQTYEITKACGATLVVCDRVHAKVLTGNFSRSLIGSANLTAPGLGVSGTPNFEVMVRVDELTVELKAFVSAVLIDGKAVDDAVYERYRAWLESQPKIEPLFPTAPPRCESDPYLTSQLPASTSVQALWDELQSEEALSDVAIHDLQLLRVERQQLYEAFCEAAAHALKSNAFFNELLTHIRESEEGFYFGQLKEWIQRTCRDIPMPHRRDLTTLVQNLYKWIPGLYPSEFEVVRPNYSELLRPIKGAYQR